MTNSITVKLPSGEEKVLQLKDITIEEFLRVSVLKSALSIGKYNELARMKTLESELHLDIIDGIAYINVFISDNDSLLESLGAKGKSIGDLPAKLGLVIRAIGNQIAPFYKELIEDYKEILQVDSQQ